MAESSSCFGAKAERIDTRWLSSMSEFPIRIEATRDSGSLALGAAEL